MSCDLFDQLLEQIRFFARMIQKSKNKKSLK